MVIVVGLFDAENVDKPFILLEHRMGFEPMNTGFADQRVSHFAIGALPASRAAHLARSVKLHHPLLRLRQIVSQIGFTVL